MIWVAYTMASKRRILALSIFGTAIIVFYLFMSSLCFGGFCISEGRPFVSGYHRAPVFYNGRKCEPDQTSIQNRHPRKSWSLREYSCEQLPKNLPTGVECITEAELGKYFWDISNPKVNIWSENKFVGANESHTDVSFTIIVQWIICV